MDNAIGDAAKVSNGAARHRAEGCNAGRILKIAAQQVNAVTVGREAESIKRASAQTIRIGEDFIAGAIPGLVDQAQEEESLDNIRSQRLASAQRSAWKPLHHGRGVKG